MAAGLLAVILRKVPVGLSLHVRALVMGKDTGFLVTTAIMYLLRC